MSRSTSTDVNAGMIHLSGGSFAMGSDRFYPEEAPVRRVRVDPFWIDATPVTNAKDATDALSKADLSKGVTLHVTNKEGSRLLTLQTRNGATTR